MMYVVVSFESYDKLTVVECLAIKKISTLVVQVPLFQTYFASKFLYGFK